MKKSRIMIAVAITAALFSAHTSVAFADATPSPAPSIDSFRAAQEQYKKERDAYFQAIRDRELKMRVINSNFKVAVDKASTDAKLAMLTATTPEQKNSINTIRRTAVAAAIVARENAIASLAPIPAPPVEPTRPMKSGPQGMNPEKGKPRR
jgi:membrane-bound lytic murein transglycosylase B